MLLKGLELLFVGLIIGLRIVLNLNLGTRKLILLSSFHLCLFQSAVVHARVVFVRALNELEAGEKIVFHTLFLVNRGDLTKVMLLTKLQMFLHVV